MTPERLNDLASRLSEEGSLSPQEERELGLALQKSAEARHLVHSYFRLEGALLEQARAGMLATPVPARVPVPGGTQRPRATPSLAVWLSGLAAAAILLGLLLLAGNRPPTPVNPPLARSSEPLRPLSAPRPDRGSALPAPEAPAPRRESVPSGPLVPSQSLSPHRTETEDPPAPLPPSSPDTASGSGNRTEESRPQEAVMTEVVLERVEGDVALVGAGSRASGRTGDTVGAGQAVETGSGKSLAVLSFPDGTRIEARSDTLLRDIRQKSAAAAKPGKSLFLQRGSVWAEVRPQPPELPLIIQSPRGEARVLGTVFTLRMDADPKGALRLDVQEGKVRFTRTPDGRGVDVSSGHSVNSGQSPDLVVLRSQEDVLSFQDGRFPAADYSGTRDTQLMEKSPQTNYGGAKILQADVEDPKEKKRASWPLLRWDLSSVPAGSRIHSVSVTLHILEPSHGQAFSFFEPARSWSETEASWKFAAAGTLWRFPGSLGGVERWGTPLGTLAPLQKGEYTAVLGEAGISLVQSWINTPATNLGLQIAGSSPGAGFHFNSREAPAPEVRPRLTLVYTPKK